MKQKVLILILLSSLCSGYNFSFGQSPSWIWAKAVTGMENETVTSMSCSGNGAVYMTGYFQTDTIHFDSITLTHPVFEPEKIFLLKSDADGNTLWAKVIGNLGLFGTPYVVADTAGNVYLASTFDDDTLSLDSIHLVNTAHWTTDIFLAKFSPQGNVLWARSAGGLSSDYVTALSIDKQGNLYLAGYFFSSDLVFDSIKLTDDGEGDPFVVKYNPDGNVVWAKSCSGSDLDKAAAVTVDKDGYVYLAGSFKSHHFICGTDTLTNDSIFPSTKVFLVRLDPGGSFLWALEAGGQWDDMASSLLVDSSGFLYLTGTFSSHTISFGNYTLTNAALSYCDIFLIKFNTDGTPLWAKSYGGSGDDVSTSLTLDHDGSMLLTGGFSSHYFFMGWSTLINQNINLTSDVFVAKIDPQGTLIWTKSVGGTDDEWANTICTDNTGNIYLAGGFDSPVFPFGSIALSGFNWLDIFYSKLGYPIGIAEPAIIPGSLHTGMLAWSFPGENKILVSFITDNSDKELHGYLSIYTVKGEVVYNRSIECSSAIEIKTFGWSKGLYLVVLNTADNHITRKVAVF